MQLRFYMEVEFFIFPPFDISGFTYEKPFYGHNSFHSAMNDTEEEAMIAMEEALGIAAEQATNIHLGELNA